MVIQASLLQGQGCHFAAAVAAAVFLVLKRNSEKIVVKSMKACRPCFYESMFAMKISGVSSLIKENAV